MEEQMTLIAELKAENKKLEKEIELHEAGAVKTNNYKCALFYFRLSGAKLLFVGNKKGGNLTSH
jgi:hypothetical protein